MRLWHIDLIPYLPKNQLVGQWRELGSIFTKQNKHILINFVYERPYNYKVPLYLYSLKVLEEAQKRHYNFKLDNFNAFFADLDNKELFKKSRYIPNFRIYPFKMNDEYLAECYFNLREKYNCGGLSKEEWEVIHKNFKEKVYNWVINNFKNC